MGHRTASHYPTKLNHKLVRPGESVPLVPHLDPLGLFTDIVRSIRWAVGRGVEQCQPPTTTTVVIGAHVEDAASASHVLTRLVGDDHLHVPILRARLNRRGETRIASAETPKDRGPMEHQLELVAGRVTADRQSAMPGPQPAREPPSPALFRQVERR